MWRLFVVLIATGLSSANLNNFAMPKYGSAMTNAVTDIILNYHVNQSSSINFFHIHNPEHHDNDEREHLDTINEILDQLHDKVIVQLEEFSNIKISPRKKVHNIIFCDTYEAFSKFLSIMSSDNFEFQGFYLIVMSKYNDELYKTMAIIFESFWSRLITNVNVLWMPSESSSEAMMYTYYPYTRFYCGKTVPVMLNQFRSGKWLKSVEHFPNKMKNLFGCPLRVATHHNAPFMILREFDDRIEVDGVDGILLRVLSQKMNFAIDLYEAEWGVLFPNGSATGEVRMVMKKQVNMTLGFMTTTPQRDSVMTSSYVYFTSYYVWMIPPGRIINSIEKLLKPFDSLVWIWFLTFLLLAMMVVIVLKLIYPTSIRDFVFGANIQSPGLNIINIVLGGTLHKLPARNFARTLLTIFMIYGFIIQNSYKGALFKYMQLDVRQRSITSTEELIAKNYTFYMGQTAAQHFSPAVFPKVLEKTVIVNVSSYPKLLDRLVNPDFKGAVLTSDAHLAHRNIEASPNRYFRHARKKIKNTNVVIYFNKNSCLVQQVNNLIVNLISGGLIDLWASNFIDRSFLKRKTKSNAVQLSIDQLSGAFQLLIAGLILSFLVFLAEIIIGRSRNERSKQRAAASGCEVFKRLRDFWNCIRA